MIGSNTTEAHPVLALRIKKAVRNGATLVMINREPTGLNRIADLVLNRSIGETLGAAVGIK